MSKSLKNLLLMIFLSQFFIYISYAEDNSEKKNNQCSSVECNCNDTIVNLSAKETSEVEGDLLVVDLRFETEAQTAKEVQSRINMTMRHAIEEIEKVKNNKQDEDVKFSTEQYSVYQHQYRTRKGEPKRLSWRGYQTLSLKGKEKEVLLDLVGKLQNMGLAAKSLQYVVSYRKQEDTKAKMLDKVIKKLQVKAQNIARSLNRQSIKFLKINVNDNFYVPQPHNNYKEVRMSSDGRSMNTPVIVPGQSKITISVSAEISIN